MKKTPYDEKFYETCSGNLRSAQIIVPMVLEYVRPASVADIGCATGDFLSVFYGSGVKDILGVDGKWVDKKKLRIPKKNFKGHDLEKPLRIERSFDLAVCVEVAEHLPPSRAPSFVKELTALAPVVLFSAATPYQGGAHHVNEQWPEYWARLFKKRGYAPVDCLRKRIWNDKEVSVWYRQNIMFFVKLKTLEDGSPLRKEYELNRDRPLSMVHPEIYTPKARRNHTMERILRFVPGPVKRVLDKKGLI